MPTTVVGIVILVVAILPGVPGDKVYRLLVGWDWREDQWQRVIRLVGFSVFGLALYATLGSVLPVPAPLYLAPEHVVTAFREPSLLPSLFGALVGHFSASGVAGFLAAVIARGSGRWTPFTVYPDAWEHFVRELVREHWVVVSLDDGSSYAGMLDLADTSVREEERDLVLTEPAEYDPNDAEYKAMRYQFLFLPGRLISSIAVVHDPESDARVTSVGETVFGGER